MPHRVRDNERNLRKHAVIHRGVRHHITIARVRGLRPGKVQEVTLELGSTSNLFGKGHRIRLDVSSSSFPRLEPNPGTDEPGMWTKRVPAVNSLHTGTGFVSLL